MSCGYLIIKCIFRVERAKAIIGYQDTGTTS